MCIYIYIERERCIYNSNDKAGPALRHNTDDNNDNAGTYIYIYMYLYIYIDIKREREVYLQQQ